MPGKVVGSGKGNSIVSIGGNNYWLNSPLQFAQGESLMLRVAGLTPMVHFSLVNRIRKNVGNGEVSTMSPTEKLLQGFAESGRSLNNNLTSLISLLHFGSNQALPQATLALIDSLRRRLLKSGNLSNPSLIRHSVLNGSLVSTGKGAPSASNASGTGLQYLLHQIVDSLAMHRGAVGKSPIMGNYQQALGLSSYQSIDGDLLKSFTRNVEEQYLNITNSKTKPQDELQLQPYRLVVELPVVFKDHIRSITIRFAGRKHSNKKESKEDVCSAEFELELQDNGFVFVRISILGTNVSIHIGSENEHVATHLEDCEMALARALDAYGLNLEVFRTEVKNGHLSPEPAANPKSVKPESGIARDELSDPTSTDEALRHRLHEAYDQGQMPELDEFKLQLDNQPVPIDTEIPVELYCAMASLFVQLLEIEKP
tara:strand:+ start:706 stop:1983 length:1278 start_codon:yes stop_codon:yes gene_type:complete